MSDKVTVLAVPHRNRIEDKVQGSYADLIRGVEVDTGNLVLSRETAIGIDGNCSTPATKAMGQWFQQKEGDGIGLTASSASPLFRD